MSEQFNNEGISGPTPTVLSGVAASWCPLDECGEHIGVTGETLRLFVRGVDGRPVLPSRNVKGRTCAQPGVAYDHLHEHAPRCRGLKKPPGYGEPAQTSAQDPSKPYVDPDILAKLGGKHPCDMDPTDVQYLLPLAGVDEGRCRIITGAVRAWQNKRSMDLRAGKTFTPDEVVDMCRACLDTWVDEIDGGAAALASHLIAWIARTTGAVLAEKDAAILQNLENEIREQLGNAVIEKVRARMEHSMQGVRSLEFVGGKDPV